MTFIAKSLTETLQDILASHSLDLHTGLPGTVKKYDAANQVADIQLGIQRVIPAVDEDLEDTLEEYPILPCVPVAWPRGGGYFIHWPLAVGDTVWVMFSEQDMNAWRNTGDVVDPGTAARHTLSGGVAIPGIHTRGNVNGSADGTNGRVGREGGPFVEFTSSEIQVGGTDALAEADALDALYDAIQNGVPVAMDGGAGLQLSIIGLLNADARWTARATTITKGT